MQRLDLACFTLNPLQSITLYCMRLKILRKLQRLSFVYITQHICLILQTKPRRKGF